MKRLAGAQIYLMLKSLARNVETVCYEILREIVRVNRAYAADKFVVYASPAVCEALLNDEYHNLAELELFIGKQVNIQTELTTNR